MINEVIKKLVPQWHAKNVKTTSFVFKLVTKYTIDMFFVFILLIGANHLFGAPIHCSSPDKLWIPAMTLQCWMDGIFLDEKMIESEIGKEVIHYGVGSILKHRDEPKMISFAFYQWIVPLLLFQTLCLFIPRALWRVYEKGTMQKLLNNTAFPVFTDDWEKQRKQLVAYIKDVRVKYHRDYALKYLFCEFLTIIVILFNMLILNNVIRDFFYTYQPAVTSLIVGNYTQFSRQAARLFPIQAKCNFLVYGPSGTIQRSDALCIVPQNVVNDKIFVIIYIWFFVILLCAILHFIYLIAFYTIKKLRIFQVGRMLEREVTIRQCKQISQDGDLGLWLTLRIFRNNLSPICFQNLCNELVAAPKKTHSFDDYDNESIYKRDSV